jgi:hypothetical protein
MLKIGSLLNEAKTFVEHGEWLPWLWRHAEQALSWRRQDLCQKSKEN